MGKRYCQRLEEAVSIPQSTKFNVLLAGNSIVHRLVSFCVKPAVIESLIQRDMRGKCSSITDSSTVGSLGRGDGVSDLNSPWRLISETVKEIN